MACISYLRLNLQFFMYKFSRNPIFCSISQLSLGELSKVDIGALIYPLRAEYASVQLSIVTCVGCCLNACFAKQLFTHSRTR